MNVQGKMGSNNKRQLSILMYPWFALGHIFPYVSTANKLAERGHKMFVIIPPKTRSKVDPLNLYPDQIEYIAMPIPRVEGLRENAETTNDGLTDEEEQLLRHALDLTKPVVQSLLCDLRPDFVFYDFMHWLPGLARDLGIKSIHYCSVGAVAASFLFAEAADAFPQSIQLSKRNARFLKLFLTKKEIGMPLGQRMTNSFCDADAVVFNTCNEIEGEYCRFLEKALRKPVILAGPVYYPKPTDLDEKWGVWLDKFAAKTLIYCAFGSEIVLERDQFEQLLLGIELTGFPFLIGLKAPLGADTVEEAFPDGFRERTRERGVVHGGWVPQQSILRHPAVGCFVTHCGYGSMWEGLMSDCRLVALPGPLGDQSLQARLLSGVLKVGVEVEKGDEDGLFTKEAVHGAIIAAMAKDTPIAKQIKQNHDKLRELLLSDGFLNSYFDTFVNNLHTLLPQI